MRPELKEELARKFNVSDTQTIFISGFQTKAPFSKGFGILYDYIEDAMTHDPKHWLAQNGLKAHVNKTIKECKNRAKKVHGIKTTNEK